MPDEYDDIVAAATGGPVRTRKGALKFQPANTDWSLDKLPELQEYFQSTYKRPLPLTVKGQGTIHNKWGLDHRSSADVSLNPSTEEGKAFIAELQKRNVPFLAFDRAIPGASTGPHIHVGRPSSRTAGKYGVGSQVKKVAKRVESYDDVIAAAVGQQQPAPTPKSPAGPSWRDPTFGKSALPAEEVRAGIAKFEGRQKIRKAIEAGVADFEAQLPSPPTIDYGNALPADLLERTKNKVRQERGIKTLVGVPRTLNPITAITDYFAGKTEDQLVDEEARARIDQGYVESERTRELVDQFTDEDKRQLASAINSMRGMGPVSRGIETGAQRAGSGLLYKLAGLTDVLGPPPATGTHNPLGEYLRRQAARGELAIAQIEEEAPPELRQQLADFLTMAVGALPEIVGATALAGPVGGFAAIGGLEATGRKQTFGQIAKETAKGATIGAVFKAAPAFEEGATGLAGRVTDTARSGAAIGLGTLGVEKLYGADDYTAARAAASNVFFHLGMKVPGEIGRFAQAAERSLKTPEGEGRATVEAELQEKLSRAETTPAAMTPPAASPIDNAATGSAVVVPPRTPAGQWRVQTPLPDGTISTKSFNSEAEARAFAAKTPEPMEMPSVEEATPPPSEPITNVPPAGVTRQPAMPAEPAAERLSTTAAPSLERRGPERMKDADWLELTPAERAKVRQEVDAEQAAVGQPEAQPIAPRRPLSELMAERAETGPAGPTGPINLLTGKPIKGKQGTEGGYIRADEIAKAIRKVRDVATTKKGGRTVEYVLTQPGGRELFISMDIDRRGVARPFIGPAEKGPEGRYSADVTGIEPMHFGVDGILALKRYLMQVHPEITRVQFERAGSTGFEVGRKVDLRPKARTTPERPAGTPPARPVEIAETRQLLIRRGLEFREVKDAPIPTFTVHNAQGREVAKFASATRERALEQLDNYAKRTEGEGGFLDLTEILSAVDDLRRKFPDKNERELRGMLPVNQRALLDQERPLPAAVDQPRSDTGQFTPGTPGGPESARYQLKTEARKYADQFKALDLHRARREGLDIVNDDIARNYFTQLRRMADEFLPAQAKAVDRAEELYNRGKYSESTMLAETVFRSLPDKVNEYSSAGAALQIIDEFGGTPKTSWSKVLQEVRDRLQRTGGLSGGGSTFYDVNKRPEGGRPDHEKIAYILEPVVEAIKSDARRLIAEGKLRAEGYVDHVRAEVNKMLQTSDFADWHPLNKSAAFGVLVDRLRSEGPPPAEAAPQPVARQRSLPKTLEKSGRDPGTNLTYDRLPNRQVNERVERRLTDEGADALESWYRSAPESAERTAAHRVLVDHYTAESVRLYDTAPQRAEALYQRGRDLSNLEGERQTTMGQATQMVSNLLKYNPAGAMQEIAKAEKAGVKVPVELRKELLKGAVEHQRLDREVRRLERELVEAEGAEAGSPPPPVGAEGDPPRPRQYRPRADTVVDSAAEKIRRKLDEAAQRRRAQKAFIASQLRALEQQQTVSGYWKRSMNITRGLMVSAFSTAMRNLQTQAIRFDIERLVDTVEHTMRRSVGLNSDLSYRNIARNTVRQFRPGQTKEAQELLRGHDAEFWRMFNTYAGGVEVPIPHVARTRVERVFQTVEKGVEIANFFNRIQEHHVRSAEFLAELDLHLRKEKGQTLEQFVNRNGIDAIPLELVRKGVDKALEVTFSDMPKVDGAGGRLLTSMIEVGNYIPPTLSPVAFPRFMFNNLKFLYQHSPAGMLDLARKDQNKPRVIARALVGTSMLLLAYQFRQSDHAGEKWYELKFGDTTLDARPFGPFSTYLFMAESVRRQLNGEKAFTTEEIAGAIGASTGPSGTAVAVAEKLYDYAANGKWDKWQRVAKQEAGEWGRALLTPVRQVKDLIAAFDASQAITRDSSAEPFLGEIKESIPYADTNLPPAHKPTSAAPLRQVRPATKAITGWRVITPKSFLEKQLDELNFKSNEILTSTGNREADAILKRVMGPLADELSAELERDAEFKSLSRAARGALLREELKRIREEARELAEEERPELFEQLKEERKPERQRKFEEELNSPGLSRAIQLGVPMSIPPKRPEEDDIAYRARLLQLGRSRRARLDGVVGSLSGSTTAQRTRLHEALYS